MKEKQKTPGKARRGSGRSRRGKRALYVIAIAVVAIGLVAAFSLGDDKGGVTPERIAMATGRLSASQTFHDFGRISMKDGKVSVRFPLRNEGEAPALVEQMYTSCMCTEASLLIGEERVGPFGMQGHTAIPPINRVIEPGQLATVEAVFDPKAHGPAGVGRNDRAVSVVMGGKRKLQLQFTAYVTP